MRWLLLPVAVLGIVAGGWYVSHLDEPSMAVVDNGPAMDSVIATRIIREVVAMRDAVQECAPEVWRATTGRGLKVSEGIREIAGRLDVEVVESAIGTLAAIRDAALRRCG